MSVTNVHDVYKKGLCRLILVNQLCIVCFCFVFTSFKLIFIVFSPVLSAYLFFLDRTFVLALSSESQNISFS